MSRGKELSGNWGNAAPKWVSRGYISCCSQSHPFPVSPRGQKQFHIAVMEAKTNRGHSIQEAKAACSNAISVARAHKTSRLWCSIRNMANTCRAWRSRPLREESRGHHNFLSSCQAALCHNPLPLRGLWLPHIISYWGKHPHHVHPFCHQGLSLQKKSHPQLLLPHQCPNSLQDLKRQRPLPELIGNMPMGGATPHLHWRASQPQEVRDPLWFKSLKPSHAEAFLRDSSIVVEARLLFFSKHSYKFTDDGHHDLSRIFKKLAVSTSLLVTTIYEIQLFLDRAWGVETSKLYLAVLTQRFKIP